MREEDIVKEIVYATEEYSRIMIRAGLAIGMSTLDRHLWAALHSGIVKGMTMGGYPISTLSNAVGKAQDILRRKYPA